MLMSQEKKGFDDSVAFSVYDVSRPVCIRNVPNFDGPTTSARSDHAILSSRDGELEVAEIEALEEFVNGFDDAMRCEARIPCRIYSCSPGAWGFGTPTIQRLFHGCGVGGRGGNEVIGPSGGKASATFGLARRGHVVDERLICRWSSRRLRVRVSGRDFVMGVST
jgi:hypothetical protein